MHHFLLIFGGPGQRRAIRRDDLAFPGAHQEPHRNAGLFGHRLQDGLRDQRPHFVGGGDERLVFRGPRGNVQGSLVRGEGRKAVAQQLGAAQGQAARGFGDHAIHADVEAEPAQRRFQHRARLPRLAQKIVLVADQHLLVAGAEQGAVRPIQQAGVGAEILPPAQRAVDDQMDADRPHLGGNGLQKFSIAFQGNRVAVHPVVVPGGVIAEFREDDQVRAQPGRIVQSIQAGGQIRLNIGANGKLRNRHPHQPPLSIARQTSALIISPSSHPAMVPRHPKLASNASQSSISMLLSQLRRSQFQCRNES